MISGSLVCEIVYADFRFSPGNSNHKIADRINGPIAWRRKPSIYLLWPFPNALCQSYLRKFRVIYLMFYKFLYYNVVNPIT